MEHRTRDKAAKYYSAGYNILLKINSIIITGVMWVITIYNARYIKGKRQKEWAIWYHFLHIKV